MSGIYIHIPFCKQACHYCDFHFSTNQSTKDAMVDAMIMEINYRKNALPKGTIIQTLYFGGGTPSLLETVALERLVNAVYKNFSVNLEEFTIEANPDDLGQKKLLELKSLGVDRLSIGIQSFHDEVLRFYNRAHSSSESLYAVQKSQDAGFEKLSIDLMYGFPSIDHSIWEKDLYTALKINPGHISSYCLTVEPKTALGKWLDTGKFKEADENFVRKQMELLMDETKSSGYTQYEISNFAIPGKEAIHNSNYWRGKPYLGIGPSAHSYDGIKRWNGVANNNKYIKNVTQGIFEVQEEILDTTDVINEYILTALRTSWGVDLAYLKINFNTDLAEIKKEIMAQLITEGLLILNGQTITLTREGKFIADSIASALFID